MDIGSSSSAGIGQTAQLYKNAYDKLLGNTKTRAKVVNLISHIFLLAAFVMGGLGVANILTPFIVGLSAVGLAVGYMIVKLTAAECKKRYVDLLSSAVVSLFLSVFGAFALTGLLSNAHLGYALMGTVAATLVAAGCMMIYAKRREERTSIPGKVPNSIYSSVAPPPVETCVI